MIKKKSNSFLSCDRKTSVNVVIWCPDETEYDEPVAVLQICHGMIEYIDRYDGFARYMAERGFVVVGNDHLGHGKSVCTDDDLGFFKDKNPGETRKGCTSSYSSYQENVSWYSILSCRTQHGVVCYKKIYM